jgi:pimeloyl-ACP methyl ester carboxylesterase
MEKRQDPEAPKHTKVDAVIADLRATLAHASAKPQRFTSARLDAYVNEWNSELGKELLFQHVRQLRPLYQNSVGSDLRRLKIPVLLLWGESDAITPVALGERMAREIPEARLVTLPGSGHMALVDAPDEVARQIVNFVK